MINKINTFEMEAALTNYYFRRNYQLVVPRLSSIAFDGINHECDLLILSDSNYATEVEIKISKADLRKDKQKWHKHRSNMIKYLYFAVPEYMIDFALGKIPKEAGLFGVYKRVYNGKYMYFVKKVKQAGVNRSAQKWTMEDRLKLAELGVKRIQKLQQRLVDEVNKK